RLSAAGGRVAEGYAAAGAPAGLRHRGADRRVCASAGSQHRRLRVLRQGRRAERNPRVPHDAARAASGRGGIGGRRPRQRQPLHALRPRAGEGGRRPVPRVRDLTHAHWRASCDTSRDVRIKGGPPWRKNRAGNSPRTPSAIRTSDPAGWTTTSSVSRTSTWVTLTTISTWTTTSTTTRATTSSRRCEATTPRGRWPGASPHRRRVTLRGP